MATVLLEPAAGQVSGTHSNFPVLITPSAHTNIGSLTLAEAESVRVYTDASLTTECARQVVSADEIWVKVPSLSSSTDLYFDWDGVRADYAVGATYGRNNVWSDYNIVLHLSSNNVDSAGNATSILANQNITYGTPNSPLGPSANFNGTNSYIRYAKTDAVPIGSTPHTVSYWVRPETIKAAAQGHTSQWTFSTSGNAFFTGTRNFSGYGFYNSDQYAYNLTSTNYPVNTWTYITTVNEAANSRLYTNGALRYSRGSRLTFTGQGPWTLGRQGELNAEYFDGQLREVRTRSTSVSADWIATEYNNHNNNAAFWDDSAVSSGGSTFTPSAIII